LAIRMMLLLQTFDSGIDNQMRDHGQVLDPPMPFISTRY